ncbi:MAG: hypothetical protein HGA87_01175 [Desulfobulbaceae bacterium]|nr:hypothetical protein [Desulfobulbaceae bacterium]
MSEERKSIFGRPPIFTSAEDMQNAIDSYITECNENNRPYTVMGLALSIGMCRDSLCEYAKKGEFSDTVKRAKAFVQMSVEERLMSGTNATGSIFWLKNNAGWKDMQALEHSGADGGAIKQEWTVNIVKAS